MDEAVAEDEEDDEDVEPFLPSVEDSSNDMALQQLLCKNEIKMTSKTHLPPNTLPKPD